MTEKNTPLLEFKTVRKAFQQGLSELVVLDDVNFQATPGEMVALVAPSGAGKSTFLHLAGLLEAPSGGDLFIQGEQCTALKDKDRTLLRRNSLGFVYQFHHLLPEFTALENVMIPMRLANKSKAYVAEYSRSLLYSVGLKNRVSHYPSQLSGGEQQRVAIARALANAPKLLLADEPTGNLDHKTGQQVFELFVELVRETGLTAVVATHNLEFAQQMDRIVTLDNGKLLKY